ncbi:MAG TPA: acylphosphatase [Dehalococcoidales bacterium]|jgi:acylphosphatase|nr:acylphosphatase [Dehalococcoidales bacterium]
MSDLVSLRAVVYGLVQGIFFRAFVSRRARELELTGYVRNLPERMVEVQAEGERDKLEKLIVSLQAGPPGARVEKVITVWSKYTGDYTGFSVRY